MKKIVSIIILILIVCLTTNGCNIYDESYSEIWACVNQFDIEGLDYNISINDIPTIEEASLDTLHITEDDKDIINAAYTAYYGDLKAVFIYVCTDVNSAKLYYERQKAMVSRIYTPYMSLVRINNVIFRPLPTRQSNSIVPEIMSDFGIEDSYSLKIHNKTQIFRSSTNKSLDEIVSKIESKGYKIVIHDQGTEDKVDSYTFLSENGTDMYEITACHNENARDYVRGYLDWFYEMETEETVTQIYYSFNDEYSLMFFGNSIETRDFWNEIRK